MVGTKRKRPNLTEFGIRRVKKISKGQQLAVCIYRDHSLPTSPWFSWIGTPYRLWPWTFDKKLVQNVLITINILIAD